jgi:hypothetical protein
MYRTVMTSVAALAAVVPMLVVAAPAAEAGRHADARHSASPSRGATSLKSSRPVNMRQHSNKPSHATGRSGTRQSVLSKPSVANSQKLAPKLAPASARNKISSQNAPISQDTLRKEGLPIDGQWLPGRVVAPSLGTVVKSPKHPNAAKSSLATMPNAAPTPIPADGIPQPGGPLLGSSGVKNAPGGAQISPRDVAKDPAAPGLKDAGKRLSSKDAAIGAGIIPGTSKAPPGPPSPAPVPDPGPGQKPDPAPTPKTPPVGAPAGRAPKIVVVPGLGFGDRQAPAVVEYVPHYAVPRYQAQPRPQLQPAKTKTSEPVCVEGVWAMQDNDKKYVCLSWYFRGRIYLPDQMAEILAQLEPKAQ